MAPAARSSMAGKQSGDANPDTTGRLYGLGLFGIVTGIDVDTTFLPAIFRQLVIVRSLRRRGLP